MFGREHEQDSVRGQGRDDSQPRRSPDRQPGLQPEADRVWSSDPFALVEKDGRLYSRGTSDMKSFIAVVVAIFGESGGKELKTPVHLAFSYDEEGGCLGAGRLIEDLASGPVVRGGRANADEAHRRAQGQEELSLHGTRARLAFRLCAERGQRRRGGGRSGRRLTLYFGG